MTEAVEFKAWPKIGRGNALNVVITEKMDGTNSCIIIRDGVIVGVQSRKRLIYPGKKTDNYGFAQWVHDNNDELLKLGDGYHYGEWAGLGIQGNPHNLPNKQFFLFNAERWPDDRVRPSCCNVVPVIYRGILEPDTVPKLMAEQKEQETTNRKYEGIVVYYTKLRTMSKHTHNYSEGKWGDK